MTSVDIFLHSSMQEEDVTDHTSVKCHVLTLMVNLLTIV